MIKFTMKYVAVMCTINTLIVTLEYMLGHITYSYVSLAGCVFVFGFYLFFVTIPLVSLIAFGILEYRKSQTI